MISQIKFLCPSNIEGDNAQLTIDDSVGGGELSYKNAKICLLGDANMDGNISVLDVTEVQNGIAGALELSEYQNKLADINNDGSVSVNDVTQIQNIITGF